MKFFKTTYKVSVLTAEKSTAEDDFDYVMDRADRGDAVASVELVGVVEIPPAQLEHQLKLFGNDGHFFDYTIDRDEVPHHDA